ncbi:uncharacterized protein LOC27208232 [Drosophila simulans]|uniref:Uncharacterized protein n=1 Tax=Drosophila simulans TaxID=7240 RepID=A0A0J9RLI1_DROSI|nr:uncharacterized protein LOC27208232 [Drosophila simulans]KMY96304.1 uncharacterized protein Dsimw501_GD28384 [Drosophila simulans]
MSKRAWNRNQRSVSLPRREFVEINPMMPGQSVAAEVARGRASSGPRMTVETLFPTSQAGKEHPNQCGKPMDRVLKESSKSENSRDSPALLLFTKDKSDGTWNKMRSKENMQNREEGSRHLPATSSMPKMDELGPGWRSWQIGDFSRKNRSSPQLFCTVPSTSSINFSSDDNNYPVSKIGDIGKMTHTVTGKAPKTRAEDQRSGNVAHLGSLNSKTKHKRLMRSTNPCIVGSEDFVYHQTLNDVFSQWDTSESPDCQPSTSKSNPYQIPKNLPSGWTAPPINYADFLFTADLEKGLEVESLMPMLLTPPGTSQPLEKNSPTQDLYALIGNDDKFPLSICTDDISKNDPLWGSTCINWEEGNGRNFDLNHVCEKALCELPDPTASPETVEDWQAVETICMRLRGFEVPGDLGLLKEPPSLDDVLEVIGDL